MLTSSKFLFVITQNSLLYSIRHRSKVYAETRVVDNWFPTSKCIHTHTHSATTGRRFLHLAHHPRRFRNTTLIHPTTGKLIHFNFMCITLYMCVCACSWTPLNRSLLSCIVPIQDDISSQPELDTLNSIWWFIILSTAIWSHQLEMLWVPWVFPLRIDAH